MLSIIVAKASNNVIGRDNKLIWHISDDLKRFKSITSGHGMIMGRKTFESLPGILPNRHHYVLTRDKNFSVNSDKVTVINDLKLLENFKKSKDEFFIIGGGEIYKTLLPLADKIYLTNVLKDFDGDTYFPQIPMENYDIIHKSEKLLDQKSGLFFEFIDLKSKE